eukprot:464250_1
MESELSRFADDLQHLVDLTIKHFELQTPICLKFDCDLSVINSFNKALIKLLHKYDENDIKRKHLIMNAMVISTESISMTLLRFIIDKFVYSSQKIHHIRKLNNIKITTPLTETNHIEKCEAYYNTINILLRNGSNPLLQQFIDKSKSQHQYSTKSFKGISSMEAGLTQCYADQPDHSWRKYIHILSFALQHKLKDHSFTPPILSVKYLFDVSSGYAVNTNVEISFFGDAFKNPFESKKNGILSPKRILELLWKGHDLIH